MSTPARSSAPARRLLLRQRGTAEGMLDRLESPGIASPDDPEAAGAGEPRLRTHAARGGYIRRSRGRGWRAALDTAAWLDACAARRLALRSRLSSPKGG